MTGSVPDSPNGRLNITRDGIEVRPRQVWEDLDPLSSPWPDMPRLVVVETVENGYALVRTQYGHARSMVEIAQMHDHAMGYRLTVPGEFLYGVRQTNP